MPHEFLCPQPAALSHFKDYLHDIRVALSIDNPFLDVQYERSGRLQHSKELIGLWHEPFQVSVGMDATIGTSALVGVGRGREDQVNGAIGNFFENFLAVAQKDVV